MMGGSRFLSDRFIRGLGFEPTDCQRNMLETAAAFFMVTTVTFLW